jgi:hypothetical protein
VVVASAPGRTSETNLCGLHFPNVYIGTGIDLHKDYCEVTFQSNDGFRQINELQI